MTVHPSGRVRWRVFGIEKGAKVARPARRSTAAKSVRAAAPVTVRALAEPGKNPAEDAGPTRVLQCPIAHYSKRCRVVLTAQQTQALSLIEQAAEVLSACRFRRAVSKSVGGEIADLVTALATARCPVAHGPPLSVADVIGLDAAYSDHAAALETQGVALIADRRGRRGSLRDDKTHVFVAPKVVTRRLLKGSRWGAHDVARALLDVPGAARRQRSLGGQRRWGIELPMVAWASLTRSGG